ncbi:hypothetical protein [Corynebacterium sp. KPL2825]|uniref:hypothetical protein n=1 Tax=Corynebacterium sp. KPL2825 TaxID=3135444 RepID=UPI0030CA0E35
MPDLTTMHLKCLLEKATPGPWTVEDDGYDIIVGNAEGHRMGWGDQVRFKFEAGDKKHDPQLAALAPELAEEVLRMRNELTNLQEEARAAAKIHATGPTAQRVFDALDTTINQILGDHDE